MRWSSNINGTVPYGRLAGRTRIVLDEQAGLLTIATVDGAGKVTWEESVCCDPRDRETFGKLASGLMSESIAGGYRRR